MGRLGLDPHARGTVSPRTLDDFRRAGFTVHRIGQTAYVHGRDHRLIFEVRGRGASPAPFAADLDQHHRWLLGLGDPPARSRRRLDRLLSEWRRGRLRDLRGRFTCRLPWWWGVEGLSWPRRLA